MPVQYSQRHSVINHSDRRSTHLGDLDISFVLLNIFSKFLLHLECYQGRIQDFKLGGGTLKKIAPSGERHENFWGISCENSRFYAKKADYRISLLPLTSNSKIKTVVSKLHCMSNL